MELSLLFLALLLTILLWMPKLNIPHWTFAGQEYLKAYYLSGGTIIVVSSLFVLSFSFWNVVILLLLFLSIAFHLRSIIPYTRFYKTELNSALTIDAVTRLKILVFNVYQKNEQYQELLKLVEQEGPDIICLLETNKAWDNGIKELEKQYPHCIKQVLENTYGMICYSKLKWVEAEILHFNKNDIPSIEMLIELGDHQVRVLVLHPEPPIIGEAETVLPKRKEIVRAGFYLTQKIEKKEECILVGDLNDVSWSQSSKLFREITGMKDPRVGRGLYSTFPAYFYFKIPLDHFYCTPAFQVNNFKTLKCKGSDHLAVVADLQLNMHQV